MKLTCGVVRELNKAEMEDGEITRLIGSLYSKFELWADMYIKPALAPLMNKEGTENKIVNSIAQRFAVRAALLNMLYSATHYPSLQSSLGIAEVDVTVLPDLNVASPDVMKIALGLYFCNPNFGVKEGSDPTIIAYLPVVLEQTINAHKTVQEVTNNVTSLWGKNKSDV